MQPDISSVGDAKGQFCQVPRPEGQGLWSTSYTSSSPSDSRYRSGLHIIRSRGLQGPGSALYCSQQLIGDIDLRRTGAEYCRLAELGYLTG